MLLSTYANLNLGGNMKDMLRKIIHSLMGLYLLWVATHLTLLISLGKTFQYKREFWPFVCVAYYSSDKPIYSYDYTEFLIYIILPVIVYIAIYHFKKYED